jgi:hypothetical protein
MRIKLSILALLAAAAANAAVTFAPVKNYPHIGFMFPCLANAKADPLPMPEATPYLLTDGEGWAREDRFSPFELWYGSQCCGRWSDPSGNRLVLGRMTRLLPAFESETVSRARFGAALAGDDHELDPRNKKHVNEWVATFVDTPVFEPERLKLNSFNLDDLLSYPCEATNTLVYAFRPRRIGNAKNFDWFCVTLRAPGAADFKALRAAFEEQFIGQLALPPRSSKDEGVESEELSTLRKGEKRPDLPNHPVRVEARKSIENYENWWHAETDGYIILSDVASDVGKSVIRDLQDKMPALRQAYGKLVPPFTLDTEISLMRLFQTRDDYVRYVGKDRAWSSGLWMPARLELVLGQEQSKDEMLRIIRHEAFHQYLSQAYCMIAAPPWLNEGHACLFENASVDAKGKVSINEDPARVRLLVENIEAAAALLPGLLKASYADFYDGTSAQRSFKYALAWGLVYYLQKGAPLERNTPFKELLPDFAAALAETRNYAEATAKTLKAVDLGVFQENFREFWLKRRASALQYDPLD